MQYTDNQHSPYTVRSPEAADYERVREICDGRFGEGYLSKADFDRFVADKDFCKVAVYDERVVGVVYLMPESRETLAKTLQLDEAYVNRIAGGKKVIHSRCAALDEDYEHRGIMYVLHQEIFDNIKQQEYGAVFAPAWTYNGYTPMEPLLRAFDFEFVVERENLWFHMDGYRCIVCGGPCRCKAAIYQKKF